MDIYIYIERGLWIWISSWNFSVVIVYWYERRRNPLLSFMGGNSWKNLKGGYFQRKAGYRLLMSIWICLCEAGMKCELTINHPNAFFNWKRIHFYLLTINKGVNFVIVVCQKDYKIHKQNCWVINMFYECSIFFFLSFLFAVKLPVNNHGEWYNDCVKVEVNAWYK